MKIKKGDNVQIVAGKDRGKQGKVLDIDPKKMRVLVAGANIFKKHQRPKKQGEKGEIISLEKYLDVSNVMLVCPQCGKVTRLGYKVENQTKIRLCKKCGSIAG